MSAYLKHSLKVEKSLSTKTMQIHPKQQDTSGMHSFTRGNSGNFNFCTGLRAPSFANYIAVDTVIAVHVDLYIEINGSVSNGYILWLYLKIRYTNLKSTKSSNAESNLRNCRPSIGFDPAVRKPIVNPALLKTIDDEHRVGVDSQTFRTYPNELDKMESR